ncbi:Bromodomain [Teratosphaeria destructans]|uniref:Bromodomain n=1 Tax=Teratosphaeria destructans TaxID=418781 RepID=A0A9W7SR21_9PEZI|nr:Bromodomain [Teratosphaeria destructans]
MTSYSPLESLLLFQALRHQNAHDQFSFNRISSQLKSIPLIYEAPGYDSGRLSPDALRDLYLSLLKEEVKRDLERQAEPENGVATIDGSRKRKASSPPLPTVQEAAQHSHLIPQLVTRLYANYREKAVREIREYERQYSALQSEIKDLEDGENDESASKQQPDSSIQSPKPSTIAHTQPASTRPANDQPSAPDATAASPTPPAPAQSRPYAQAKIDAVINHGPEPQHSPGPHRRASSSTKLPPLSEMAPQSPRFGIPPNIPKQMPHVQQQTYSHSPPSAHQSPFMPHHAHPAPGPPMQNNMPRPPSRHDPSPRPILPPPPGMQLPPPGPPQHVGSPNMHAPMQSQQHYQQQHRGSIGPAPASGQPPYAHPPPMQHPPAHQGYYQQSPYQDRRTSYPPPRHSLSQLEPFYMGNPEANKQQQRQSIPPHQPHPSRVHHPVTQTPRQPMYQQYPPAPATAPVQTPRAHPRMPSILSALATPSRPEYKPTWKSERRPLPMPLPAEPRKPEIEPLSPVRKPIEPARPPRAQQDVQATKELPPPPPQQGLRPPKSRRRPTRAGSPSSVASSTLGESTRRSTRSQSVSTVVGANLLSDSAGSVKDEPSTPAGVLDHPEHQHESSATPASGMMTRKRRGTVPSHTQHPLKRRRQGSPTGTHEDEDMGPPPPRSNTITAYRNFAKISSTIMNDISSHKHASYFAGPVREKDASGYSDIIKQPQHLKAIRSAITAGTRAVAQAIAPDSPEATPTNKAVAGDSMAVELERTGDLMPPKVIVNGAQLEKEVYRMLANAVMFNPGEDGLVAETREMFEDVEAKIRAWKGIPKEGDGGEEKEEVVEEGKGKRRKV